MREQQPRVKATTVRDITVVELTDKKILDEMSISQIGEQLKALALGTQPKIVIDFSSVAYLSSSALGMLITVNKHVRQSGGQLRLCGIAPEIYEVFVITRLNEIFQISQTREQALQGF